VGTIEGLTEKVGRGEQLGEALKEDMEKKAFGGRGVGGQFWGGGVCRGGAAFTGRGLDRGQGVGGEFGGKV